LANRVKTIKNELSIKVKREFEEHFSSPFEKVGFFLIASFNQFFKLN
jgi:hypothetical protein